MSAVSQNESFLISLVVPMYNEQEVLPAFFERVRGVMDGLGKNYEIICVNDGSSDGTLDDLVKAHQEWSQVKVLSLSRNFGKELALTAGLEHASGDVVIPIDADLQDPPEIIPDMLREWENGFEVVLAVRKDRSVDSFAKRNSARWFYSVMERMGEIPIPPNAGDFRLMDRKVVDSLTRLQERTRFMKGLFAWVGYKTTVIEFVREKRVAGESAWKYWKLWNFALEGIVSFSSLPLKVWSYLGAFTSLIALIYMFAIIGRTLLFGIDVPGYASLLVLLLFFSGLNLICLGVIGEYLGRIFVEVKQRPLYLISETHGLDSE